MVETITILIIGGIFLIGFLLLWREIDRLHTLVLAMAQATDLVVEVRDKKIIIIDKKLTDLEVQFDELKQKVEELDG